MHLSNLALMAITLFLCLTDGELNYAEVQLVLAMKDFPIPLL